MLNWLILYIICDTPCLSVCFIGVFCFIEIVTASSPYEGRIVAPQDVSESVLKGTSCTWCRNSIQFFDCLSSPWFNVGTSDLVHLLSKISASQMMIDFLRHLAWSSGQDLFMLSKTNDADCDDLATLFVNLVNPLDLFSPRFHHMVAMWS